MLVYYLYTKRLFLLQYRKLILYLRTGELLEYSLQEFPSVLEILELISVTNEFNYRLQL